MLYFCFGMKLVTIFPLYTAFCLGIFDRQLKSFLQFPKCILIFRLIIIISVMSGMYDLLTVNVFQYVHVPKKNGLYLMWKLIIVRAAVVGYRKMSVRLACRYPTMRMLLLPFARQTYVCTIIVRWKYDSEGQPVFFLKLYMARTTGTSKVRL